jgi:hydrogenase large subunit
MAKRIVIDPITRIEGHLRIECETEGGKVSKAWASGQMWRGIENIVKGRDAREVWLFTQRICGV